MATLGGLCSRDYASDRVLAFALATLACSTNSCTFLPAEFNLSPIYRHRLDEAGDVLELDVLWPFVHYERTPEGGDDFRIRPFYRYLSEPDAEPEMSPSDGNPDFGLAATEHQFLWPLGRVRIDKEQTLMRLWPFWSHSSRLDNLGLRETDWYFIFPFVWGGSREDGNENYFGIFPIYTDFPDFFTYSRFRSILFPLYLNLEKQGQKTHIFMWPFLGWSDGPRGFWHRILPLYSYRSQDFSEHLSLLWPFFHVGSERIDSDDPIHRYFLWPLFGQQWSESGSVSAWTALWPFFQYISQEGRRLKLDLLWPLFRYEHDNAPDNPLQQWWLFPLIARTVTNDQWAWNFLWPLLWLREYRDPGSDQQQTFFVPFFTDVHRQYDDGTEDDYRQVWPLWHNEDNHDGTGDWSLLSPLPWRAGNTYGIDEAYDWLWTIVKGRQRAPDDNSVEAIGNLYTSRTRGNKTQTSVPLLFNYESDEEGSVLRLFQFLPIWSSSNSPEPATAVPEGGPQ